MNQAEAAGMPLIRVENLTKTYVLDAAPVKALRDVTLTIASGEFTALAGPSGSGKTTLLNLIGALDVPSGGCVALDGESLSGRSRAQLADLRLRKIGFVFQDFNLLPVLSALENVEYVLLLQGVPQRERRRRAEQALQAVGLDGLQDRLPAQLSGGQRQRVAVARAIVGEPRILLADEPTANLDSGTGSALIEMMLDLNRAKQITFLFSTHDERIMRRARRLISLKDGRIAGDSADALP